MVLVCTMPVPLPFSILIHQLRPVLGEQRLSPDEFAIHRTTHKFRNPCCLCAANTGRYTELVVDMDLSGPNVGEYVARCSTDTCGYFGILISISGLLTTAK